MKTFEVTIRATVTKTYTVQAKDKHDAYNEAHEVFTVSPDDANEYYDEETIDIREVHHADTE